MCKQELILSVLEQICETLSLIIKRTAFVQSVDDFYLSESGMILLDSVCMKLVAVGEAVKNLDKLTNRELLRKYPSINWKDIKGMRILSFIIILMLMRVLLCIHSIMKCQVYIR